MSSADAEIIVVGGGPAGLATAIRAARAGFRTTVFERAMGATDKACGEGLMPHGVRALEALGALKLIAERDCAPFQGIRYLLENGRAVDARFRRGAGLGIRRTALSAALREVAANAGVDLQRASVRSFRSSAGSVEVETELGTSACALLVGADGLQSQTRAASGLALTPRADAPHRFGLRRHFACAPWSDLVEVHWTDGAECYVTPVGPDAVNVAFLWSPRALPRESETGFDALLARFPVVARRLEGAAPLDEARGSGPLWRPTRARSAGRIALVGDAAGYVDAVTGQGLSLAFTGAEALVDALPRALSNEAALSLALTRYDRSLRSAWRRYAVPARALLALADRPTMRRSALGAAARAPRLFAFIVDAISAG